MIKYLDRQRQPISVLEWGEKFEDPDYKFLGDDTIGDCRIATIWVGHELSHGRLFGPAPELSCIFETMAFPSQMMWRYSTEAEACEGHARACWAAICDIHFGRPVFESTAWDKAYEFLDLLIMAVPLGDVKDPRA